MEERIIGYIGKERGGREIGGVMDRRIERKRALGRKGYFWIYNTFRIIYGDLNLEIFSLRTLFNLN